MAKSKTFVTVKEAVHCNAGSYPVRSVKQPNQSLLEALVENLSRIKHDANDWMSDIEITKEGISITLAPVTKYGKMAMDDIFDEHFKAEMEEKAVIGKREKDVPF